MTEEGAQGRGRLLTVLGTVGVLLAALSVIMVVLVGMGVRHFIPPLVTVLTPVVGLSIALFVWNRSAHDLEAMARGDMDRSCRRSTGIASKLGKIGSVIAGSLILIVTLFLVAGYVLLGPNPSGP